MYILVYDMNSDVYKSRNDSFNTNRVSHVSKHLSDNRKLSKASQIASQSGYNDFETVNDGGSEHDLHIQH